MADHVFISYARADQAFVLPLATRLRESGVAVWLDQWSIPPGQDWELAIEDAVFACARFLIVLSPASVRRRQVRAELRIALDENKPVVPVLYQQCRVPGTLRLIQHVDCIGRSVDDGDVLLEILGALGVQPAAQPRAASVPAPVVSAAGSPTPQPQASPLEAALGKFRLPREELVRIPAGEFTMGSPEGEGEEEEHPQHPLYLPEFYIMRAPVTNAQYRLFVEPGGYREKKWWTEAGWAFKEKAGRTEPRYWRDAKWNQPDYPVVDVSWYEALAFARWAGGALPSEAEWEKAASWDPTAGRKRPYPWGDEWDAGRCNTKEGGPGRTTPVGHYSPQGDSAYGLADMAGNVWEWTRSLYGVWGGSKWEREYRYPYASNDGREALDSGDAFARVLRGGSWVSACRGARCAVRDWYLPGGWSHGTGFRACLSLGFSDF